MKSLLIADDNKEIRELLSNYARKEGYKVDLAKDGEEALKLFKSKSYDLLILDIMMPYIDGLTLCKKIREESTVPILLLTAKSEEYEKIMGLDSGADDYIVKPSSPLEIMARVRAQLRRIQLISPNKNLISNKGLNLNLDNFTMKFLDEEIKLTKREFELIWTLASSPGRVFTRDKLLDDLWGYDYDGDSRNVDTHIKRLRAKLPADDKRTFDIETIRGMGYRFTFLEDKDEV